MEELDDYFKLSRLASLAIEFSLDGSDQQYRFELLQNICVIAINLMKQTAVGISNERKTDTTEQ